jgi:hypothetical protein
MGILIRCSWYLLLLLLLLILMGKGLSEKPLLQGEKWENNQLLYYD